MLKSFTFSSSWTRRHVEDLRFSWFRNRYHLTIMVISWPREPWVYSFVKSIFRFPKYMAYTGAFILTTAVHHLFLYIAGGQCRFISDGGYSILPYNGFAAGMLHHFLYVLHYCVAEAQKFTICFALHHWNWIESVCMHWDTPPFSCPLTFACNTFWLLLEIASCLSKRYPVSVNTISPQRFVHVCKDHVYC